jgi:hypothetical protein
VVIAGLMQRGNHWHFIGTAVYSLFFMVVSSPPVRQVRQSGLHGLNIAAKEKEARVAKVYSGRSRFAVCSRKRRTLAGNNRINGAFALSLRWSN